MKKIDYFWPRALCQITGIVFLTQVPIELSNARLPGFEWVIYACGAAFLAALLYAATVVVVNANRSRQNDTAIAVEKEVGYWMLSAYFRIAVYKKPSWFQIKTTEMLLGWKWRDGA